MKTKSNSNSWIKRTLAIVLLVGVAAVAGSCINSSDGTAKSEDVFGDIEEYVEQQNESVAERLTKAELEASINNTTDGSVPEDIINKLSINEQKVIVKNDPNACLTAGISEVWLLKSLGIYSNIIVVEEECIFDSNNRLETLVIIAE